MIEKITFSYGAGNAQISRDHVVHSGLTIFVGPNNCGKSAALERIFRDLAVSSNEEAKKSVVQEVSVSEEIDDLMSEHPDFSEADDGEEVTFQRAKQSKSDWHRKIQAQWVHHLGREFRSHFAMWLNGSQRLRMLTDESEANLKRPTRPLSRMLTDDERRKEFQKAVHRGIGLFPLIDTVGEYGKLKLAFHTMVPDPTAERSLSPEWIDYVTKAIQAKNASDGVNAYVGILSAFYSTDCKVIVIDEPEAFLHPALSRLLGNQIAKKSGTKQTFVATHSADFIMGAVESGADISIFRLSYQNDASDVCLLKNEELRDFMNDPLLRSSSVLSGLFAKSVVVCESDSDRAFYQEINTRLIEENDERGIKDCLFLNAQNKQTVPRIVRLLRKMSVPTASVVDLDVLSEGGENWKKQVGAAGLPEATHQSISALRLSVFERLKAVSSDQNKKDYKTRGGLNLLDEGDKEAAYSLLKTLSDTSAHCSELMSPVSVSN